MKLTHDMRLLAAFGIACALVTLATPTPAGAQATSDDDAATGETPADPTKDAPPVEEADAPDADMAPAPDAAEADDTAPATEPATSGEAGALATPGAEAEAAPAADDTTADEASDEASGEEEPARTGPEFTFANSFFSWTNGVTVNTFAPGAQLTYDPTWQMSFSLTPRFYLTDTTFLWLNQGLWYEVTDANDGTYNREPLLSDTLLDLRQIFAWEGFVFQPQARLGFPLSKASQAAGRILQTGLGLTVARPFAELASFTVAGTFGYRRWWQTRNVPTVSQPYAGNCTQPDPLQPPICTQASGSTNGRDILLAGISLSVMPVSGLTVSGSAFYMAMYGEELAPASIPINGGTTTIPDRSITHWRAFTYFSLAVAYDVLPWLNLQLGIQNSANVAPLYNPDGSVRSPFTADTQIFLSTTIGLDGLYEEIFEDSEDDGLTPEERQRRRQGLASRGQSNAF